MFSCLGFGVCLYFWISVPNEHFCRLFSVKKLFILHVRIKGKGKKCLVTQGKISLAYFRVHKIRSIKMFGATIHARIASLPRWVGLAEYEKYFFFKKQLINHSGTKIIYCALHHFRRKSKNFLAFLHLFDGVIKLTCFFTWLFCLPNALFYFRP